MRGERVGDRERLAAILRLAYSGELAAAYAYRGHWRSLSSAEDRARIRTIEEEELQHRRQVGKMLAALGHAPSRLRELRATCVGRTLGLLCHVSGWLAPMYGAGRLESRNIGEYERAGRLARDCGRNEWVDCLLTMAEVEWDHEQYFRSRVRQHWLGRRLPLWPAPSAREHIRASFARESASAAPADMFANLVALAVFLVPILASCSSEGTDATAQPANLLFISLDTTRADHLGFYGYERDTTPRLDEFAEQCHRFDAMFTAMPTTLPSHAAMFTSLYPAQLGMQKNGDALPQQVETLAESLRAHGFATAGFVSAKPLLPDFGIDQGFDVFEAPEVRDVPASVMRPKATAWLNEHRARGEGAFFCFVHFFDSHTPYTPPDEFRELFDVPPGKLPVAIDFNGGARGGISPEDVQNGKNAYDAEIRYADHEIGGFLDDLSAAGILENTIVVFVSDHGEELDELKDKYGYLFDHGDFLTHRGIRVPFLLRIPPSFDGVEARGHADVVSTLDIKPTLLDLLGIPTKAPMEGRSLRPLLRGEVLPEAVAITERHKALNLVRRRMGPETSIVSGRWHWIQSAWRKDELFDLQADPGETTNVIDQHGDLVDELSHLLDQWNDKVETPLFQAEEVEIDDTTRAQLEELGYLGGEDEG